MVAHVVAKFRNYFTVLRFGLLAHLGEISSGYELFRPNRITKGSGESAHKLCAMVSEQSYRYDVW